MSRMSLVFAAAALLRAGAALAQNGAPAAAQKPAEYSGCLTPAPQAGSAVLASGGSCYYVPGAVAQKAAGHEVVLKGTVIPQQGRDPLTLVVQGVVAVRAACTRTCVLQPPGTRGLGSKNQPGPEGATKGLTDSPHP